MTLDELKFDPETEKELTLQQLLITGQIEYYKTKTGAPAVMHPVYTFTLLYTLFPSSLNPCGTRIANYSKPSFLSCLVQQCVTPVSTRGTLFSLFVISPDH